MWREGTDYQISIKCPPLCGYLVSVAAKCWGKGDSAARSLCHINKGGHCENCGGNFDLLMNGSDIQPCLFDDARSKHHHLLIY